MEGEKLTSVLTGIGSSLFLDLDAPLNTLDVNGRGWVGTLLARINSGITFKVDIEGNTAILLITVLSTLDSVVGFQGLVTEIRGGLARTLELREGKGVTLWGRSFISDLIVLIIF